MHPADHSAARQPGLKWSRYVQPAHNLRVDGIAQDEVLLTWDARTGPDGGLARLVALMDRHTVRAS